MIKEVLLERIILVYNYLWDQNLTLWQRKSLGFSTSLWQKTSFFLSQKSTETAVAYRDCNYSSLCLLLHWLCKLRRKCGFYMSSHMKSYLQQLKTVQIRMMTNYFWDCILWCSEVPNQSFSSLFAVLGLWTTSSQVACLDCQPHLPRVLQAKGLLCTLSH